MPMSMSDEGIGTFVSSPSNKSNAQSSNLMTNLPAIPFGVLAVEYCAEEDEEKVEKPDGLPPSVAVPVLLGHPLAPMKNA
jgi:hypothetical protein